MFFVLGLPWLGEILSWSLSRALGRTSAVAAASFVLSAAVASQGVVVFLVLLFDGQTVGAVRGFFSSSWRRSRGGWLRRSATYSFGMQSARYVVTAEEEDEKGEKRMRRGGKIEILSSGGERHSAGVMVGVHSSD